MVGYALDGRFSFDNMPAPLRALLDDYDRQLQALQTSGIEEISNPYASKVEKVAGTQPVAPLLGDICWSQDEPFNALCPMDKSYKNMRTPVGCVATAAAQIMKYHGYPAHGIGNKTYITSQGQTVSADFEAATYDWANMLPDYNGTFTQRQADAVALLSYHVAAAAAWISTMKAAARPRKRLLRPSHATSVTTRISNTLTALTTTSPHGMP